MATSTTRFRRVDMVEIVSVIEGDVIHIINQVKNYLSLRDVISILFLLFDDFRLLMKLMFDTGFSPLDTLMEWALRSPSNWKEVLIEALCISQQFKILKVLGLQNTSLIQYYSDHKCKVFFVKAINNALYRLCEHMSTGNLAHIRSQLSEFNMNITDNDTSEEILLKVMKENLISTEPGNCNLQLLTSSLDNIPDLQKFATELRICETALNSDSLSPCQVDKDSLNSGTQDISPHCDDNTDCRLDGNGNQPSSNSEIKPGACSLIECYPIGDTERPGVCIIINQEIFHSTDEHTAPRETRKGSTCDRWKLTQCMERLKFRVFPKDNLCSKTMLEYIKDVIRNDMIPSDSIFMLCILSHGIRGHVYGADSIRVNVENIQHIVTQELQRCKFNIPKIMLIQACQVDEPGLSNSDKLYCAYAEDFLVFWATVPGSVAMRCKLKGTETYLGSLFVDITAKNLLEFARHNHMSEIHTSINSSLITKSVELLGVKQVSMCHSTLTKRLYLQRPVR